MIIYVTVANGNINVASYTVKMKMSPIHVHNII